MSGIWETRVQFIYGSEATGNIIVSHHVGDGHHFALVGTNGSVYNLDQASSGGYVLPPATTSSLGGVIVDSGLSVSGGVISAPVMGGASAGSAGTAGLVPAAAAGHQNDILTGSGFQTPTTDAYNFIINSTPELYKLDRSLVAADANGIFTTVQYSRSDGTLAWQSVLSGGSSPTYTTRTVTRYAKDGITVISTTALALTYDAYNNLLTEA